MFAAKSVSDDIKAPDLEVVRVGGKVGGLVGTVATKNSLKFEDQMIESRVLPPLNGAPPSNCFTSGSGGVTINFQTSVNLLIYQESYLEINYTVASADVVTNFPLTHWFAQISMLNKLGAGTPLWFATPTMLLTNLMCMTPQQQDCLFRDALIDPQTFGLLRGGTLKVGANQIMRLPLFGSWLDVTSPAMQGIPANTFTLQVQTVPQVIGSGTASNFTVNSMNWVVIESKTRSKKANVDLITRGMTQASNYLYPQVIMRSGDLNYTASGAVTISLQTFQGMCGAILVNIRANTSLYTSNAATNYKYLDLGRTTTYDIKNGSNQSEWSGGTSLSLASLKANAAWNLPFAPIFGKDNMGIVILPFASNLMEMTHGMVNGFFPFTPSQVYNLVITQGPAAVAEVLTIVAAASVGGAAATPTAGFWSIVWNGQKTSPLAFNSSTAVVQAAIQALPFVAAEGYTPTVSATLAGGSGTVTITFDAHDGSPTSRYGVPQVVSEGLLATATPLIASVALTTLGVAGAISGTGYTTEVIGYFYANSKLSPGGDIKFGPFETNIKEP